MAVTILLAATCAPSDPDPPVRFNRTNGTAVVELKEERTGDAELVLVEVVRNPSRVLSDGDERVWRVVGSRENAVPKVTLGRPPQGWREEIRWTPPDSGSDVVVRVEVIDGRVFLVDGRIG